MAHNFELQNGDLMPAIGFGTWDATGDQLRQALQIGFDVGYTHVDTAEGYGNEAIIGEVIGDQDRDSLFITSKALPSNLGYESLIRSCKQSLDRLGTEYLDLYLIHWPNPAISLRETLDAMAALHERGLVRNVGVSNFSTYQLSVAQHISKVPIAVNQIEFHPLFQRPELLQYCKDTETQVVAAAPLARGAVFEESTIQKLAENHGRPVAGIVLNWIIKQDIVALPKSLTPEHVRDNINVFEWELDESDMNSINRLNRDDPVYDTRVRDWSDDIYGIEK